MRFSKVLIAIVTAIGSMHSSLASDEKPTARLASKDEAAMVLDIEAVMAEMAIPGAQVVIVFPEAGTWQRSLGLRDIASQSAMSDETLIQAGSVTKLFTASLLADLVAKGKLRWSDTLAERLPGVPMRADVATITIDELVTHTSGLPSNPPNRIDVDGVMQPYSTAQLYASLSDPAFALEEYGRNYSNWGFAILGHVVEKTANQRFEDLLKSRIFDPLEMTNSAVSLSSDQEQRLATHYWPEDSSRIPRPRWVFGEVAGFGGITSTARDLARFLSYQIRPKPHTDAPDPAEVRALRDVRVLLPSWGAGGGRAWLVVRDREDGTITLEHSGEVDGHSSYVGFSPTTEIGIAVMANLGESSARRIALAALKHAMRIKRSGLAVNREDALLLARKRQWGDAEIGLVKITSASSSDGEAWHQLGVARYEMHDLHGAVLALTRAQALLPMNVAPLFLLARIAASQGRIDDAFALLDRAVQLRSFREVDLDLAELRPLHMDKRWPKLLDKHRALQSSSPISATATRINPISGRTPP